MGTSFSSQSTYNTINSFTSMINSFSSRILNEASVECASTQITNVYVGTTLVNGVYCGLSTTANNSNLNNKTFSQLTCGLTQENLNKVSVSFQNNLSQAISQWIALNLTQNNGWLATGINIASQMGVNQTDLNSLLSNTISEDISNLCKASVSINQTQNYYYCGTFDNFNIDISLTAKGASLGSCINSNIQSAVATNKQLLDIVQKTDEAVTQSNSGLFDFIIWIIVGLVLIAVIGGVVTLMSGSGGSNYPSSYSNYSSEIGSEAGNAEELAML